MKITVKLQDRLFEVEIDDLNARPIVATVEGERFEVWPDSGESLPPPVGAPRYFPPAVVTPTSAPGAPRNTTVVRAPIPGVIVSIAVQAGDTVEVGQVLCVLEAMKMKNAIRAPRAGEIGQVLVKAGEHVRHHDVLIEFAA